MKASTSSALHLRPRAGDGAVAPATSSPPWRAILRSECSGTLRMNRRLWAIAWCFTVLGLTAATPEVAWAIKDQSRIGEEGADAETQVPPPPEAEPDELAPPDSPEFGAIAPVETVELTLDAAKRALDAFADVRDKYNDQGIENFESLEEFVTNTDAGKRLEADIKAHGFSDVTEWN